MRKHWLLLGLAACSDASAPPTFDPPPAQVWSIPGAVVQVPLHIDGTDVEVFPSFGVVGYGPSPFTLSLQSDTSTVVDVRVRARSGNTFVTRHLQFVVADALPVPEVESFAPSVGRAGEPWQVRLQGRYLRHLEVEYDGEPVWIEEDAVQLPARPRGLHRLELKHPAYRTELELWVQGEAPRWSGASRFEGEEDQTLRIPVRVQDPEGDAFRVLPQKLPPGARFDDTRQQIVFRPDFIQGGQHYTAELLLFDAEARRTVELDIEIADTIPLPEPKVVSETTGTGTTQFVLQQNCNTFLDPHGRDYQATLTVPTSAEPKPVRVYLHGFGGRPFRGGGDDAVRLYPHDPDNTYWWGQKGPNGLQPYTARRVLALVEWVLQRFPQADAERVYLHGSSMGGAGASLIAAHWPRHFAFSENIIGQTVGRLHRPSRIKQLSLHYGPPGPAWDVLDLSAVLRRSFEARQQWFFFRHAIDDPIIHFSTMIAPSPVTGRSVYTSLQHHKVGHVAFWDEGAHGPPDPVMGARWFTDNGRAARPFEMRSRNQPFIAFSNSSADQQPPTFAGAPTDPETGPVGQLETPGDSGYGPPFAGGINRFVYADGWVDEADRVEVDVGVHRGGRAAPRADYPSRGYGAVDVNSDITVDATLRRLQRFHLAPGEWVHLDDGRRLQADRDGTLTIPGLRLTQTAQRLRIRRVMPLP